VCCMWCVGEGIRAEFRFVSGLLGGRKNDEERFAMRAWAFRDEGMGLQSCSASQNAKLHLTPR